LILARAVGDCSVTKGQHRTAVVLPVFSQLALPGSHKSLSCLGQGATLAPPWASFRQALRLIPAEHDGLLAIKLGLVVLIAVLSRRHEVRVEDIWRS
jgi:hypothetical protein